MSGPLSWLREAAASIQRHEHPGHTLVGDDAAEFMTRGGLRFGRLSMRDGSNTGFSPDGAVAIGRLARQMVKTHPRLKHGSRHLDLAAHLASLVLDRFPPPCSTTASKNDLEEVEKQLLAWFDGSARKRRHYVPCALVAGQAPAFDVGPVTFVHGNDLAQHPRGLPDDGLTEFTRDRLFQALNERSASWIAIVEVDGCQLARSTELADLATDVAIGAVQLVMPGDSGARMARITARTLPPWRGSLAIDDESVSPGFTNMEAGHGLDPRMLAVSVYKFSPLLESAGHSITALLSDRGPCRTLRGAWCDAVYWYHEATAETLTTVAAVKFETAIESMLRTKRETGSGERMKQAVRILTGLGPGDALPGSPERKVDSYTKSLAEARSKVLHGTLSTLADDVGEERHTLEWLARWLLIVVALAFAEFNAEDSSTDDVESLLSWFDRQRTAAHAGGADV